MAIDPLSAAKLYQAAARRAVDAGAAGGPEAASGVDFGGMVQGALARTTEATRTAETASLNAIAGRADIVDVVTAIAAAETTLETVMAVRDQVIQAYQEILRMPI